MHLISCSRMHRGCNRIAVAAASPQLDQAYDIYRRMRLCVSALRFPQISLSRNKGDCGSQGGDKAEQRQFRAWDYETIPLYSAQATTRQSNCSESDTDHLHRHSSPLYQASISSPKHTNRPHPHPNQLTFLLPSNQKEYLGKFTRL